MIRIPWSALFLFKSLRELLLSSKSCAVSTEQQCHEWFQITTRASHCNTAVTLPRPTARMVLSSLLGARKSAFVLVGGAFKRCRHARVLLRRDSGVGIALSRTYGSSGAGKKVLFFGTDSFSLETLKTLHQSLWVELFLSFSKVGVNWSTTNWSTNRKWEVEMKQAWA